jgi:predicted small lipoprotein YifL
MSDKPAAHLGFAAFIVCAMTACGQTGPLYLPEPAKEVVSSPDEPPPSENTQAPNSPRTPDSPPEPPSPAPEVTAPEGTPPVTDPKKEKGAASSPPK